MDNTPFFRDTTKVDHTLKLFDRLIAILDHEEMLIAAAKLDEARCDVQAAAGRAPCLSPP